MSYRSLLVCLDEGPRAHEMREFAMKLALAHDARITGLLLEHSSVEQKPGHGPLAALSLKAEEDLHWREQKARQEFEDQAHALGLQHAWFVAREFDEVAVINFARCFDLVIADQVTPARERSRFGGAFQDSLLVGVGRPVLLLPHDSEPKPDFNHVVLAWNGSRESARALTDAMPLLERAERVTVITALAPPARNARRTLEAPDIIEQLRRHHIHAEHIVNACAPDQGNWLLTRAQGLEMRADLLVTGAYGHSRVSEIVFGGVTRTLLKEMSVPVLMSH